jgi:hypothetical protein
MKNTLSLFLILIALTSCNTKSDSTTSNVGGVSLIEHSKNSSDGILVAYTSDSDSLWMDVTWINGIQKKMIKLSSSYSTILLFDSRDHTPDVSSIGMGYHESYDKYMICGYWIYPNGSKKFCYGGMDENGNWNKCK